VRIALNLKGQAYEPRFVHLLRRGGEHHLPDYLELNPQGLVPTLIDGDQVLTQSLAIIEYLEERFPEPPLLPALPAARAHVRSLALAIACEIHPLQNLRVCNYLKNPLGRTEQEIETWRRHWIMDGLEALERRLEKYGAGDYCWGDTPTLADVCLIPQIYNALRFRCDLSPLSHIPRIYRACTQLPAFSQAAPDQQPDADTLPN
jgi:maleylpyruvate isomerase